MFRASFAVLACVAVPFATSQDSSQHLRGAAQAAEATVNGSSSVVVPSATPMDANVSHEQKVENAQREIDAAVANSNATDNSTLSSAFWGWHHGVAGETCCMCAVQNGWETILYSAADYDHWYGSHSAQWECMHECPQRCGSDWHHGRYFGCYDESHLHEMDSRYGHSSGYSIAYGHFGGIC